MSLDETLTWFEKVTSHFTNKIILIKNSQMANGEAIEELITMETINEYKGLALSLKYPYLSYKTMCSNTNMTKKIVEQGLLFQSWKAFGSCLECTIRLFLNFYYRFYYETNWCETEELKINNIKEILIKNIEQTIKESDKYIGENKLTNEIKNSLLNKIKELLEQNSGLFTLSHLIDFYIDKNVLENTLCGKESLQKIKEFRIEILSFKKSVLSSWEDLNKYLKLLIKLIIDMLHRLPEVPYDESMLNSFTLDIGEIAMKEKVWFENL